MMTKYFALNWVTLYKPGDLAASTNSGKYLDFNISGESLKEYLGISTDNSVTPFGWFLNKSEQSKALKEFRLQTKPHLADNRIEIYICNECGDIGCGSVTVQIHDRGEKIVWAKFAKQHNPDEISSLFDVEDLELERTSYFAALAVIK